ncbi:Quinidine resistance protein 1 [Leucoagaricus sp. SymC.cos]|nr:Quinidine resistance protein 1 [Leucoagaricus sp. SymC.cos]
MPSLNERTSLLGSDPSKTDLVYRRFSPAKKRVIVAIVSWGGLVPFFTSGTFIPSIPQIAKELHTTGEAVSFAVSIYILAAAFGSLIGSAYATFYGRRPAYLYSLPVMFIGSIGVARAQSVRQLLIFRFLQALGASPGTSVGFGVIGDIYRLEERGRAMGSYYGATLVGLALAPMIGGFFAHQFSWRFLHLTLAAFALGAFLCILFYFPETSHPGSRGVDKLEREGGVHPGWRPIILNPFSQLDMLRSPSILAVSLGSFLTLQCDFVLLVPLAYTIGKRYGIVNETIIGACFLPCGIGNAIGAPLSGWISDLVIIRSKRQRGVWYPEDRLRATLFGLFLPIAVILSGVITKQVPGTLGLVLNLVCLFFTGVAVDIVLTPCGAYVVDILHSRSAESAAVINAFRYIALSVSTATILPSVNILGHLTTNVISAALACLGFFILWITILFGDSMRAWVNIGFTT